MKKFLSVFSVIVGVAGMLLFGCSSDNSTSPAAGEARIEGQLVADVVQDLATSAPQSLRDADDAPRAVYPVSGVTAQLIQDGAVIATATTDEYGRFQFSDLAAGEYDVRVVSDDEAVVHYHVVVAADQSLTVYGRIVDGDCLWDGEYGSNWSEMTQGAHWGNGFLGASPGQGYWHDGQEWCDGTGPHGQGGSQNS